MTTCFEQLVGRPIVLLVPHNGHTHGVIVEALPGFRFGVHLFGYEFQGRPITVDMHRAEFILPPGPRRRCILPHD